MRPSTHALRTPFLAAVLVLALAGTTRSLPLAKFEPPTGCYIGAFIEKDDRVNGDFAEFERLTARKHASYFTYVGYGRPFPADWVAKVKAAGASPHVALEPNDGLAPVQDDEYLRAWARDAYEADCPLFLRFASEMNGSWSAYHGDPALYRDKFRLVHDVMAELAPNVAMVWTPFAVPQGNIQDYYPGDDYVDWVGINIYSVYVHDGDPDRPAANEDPIEFLRFIYDTYADRKPIQVSEFAATHYCRAVNRSTEAFAVAKMKRFYSAVAEEFPRVKMINWFSFDSLRHGIADNNYSLTDNEGVLETYRALVASDHFLDEVPYDRAKYRIARAPQPVGPAPAPADLTPPGIRQTPPPLPDARPAAPPTRPQPLWSESDWDSLLSTRGANITQISTLHLRGIRPQQELTQPVELAAVVPTKIAAVYAIFELDGRAVRLTNIAPFRCTLSPDMLQPGKHEIRATVTDQDGNEHPVPGIAFRVPQRDDN